jgi:hypothetical protein
VRSVHASLSPALQAHAAFYIRGPAGKGKIDSATEDLFWQLLMDSVEVVASPSGERLTCGHFVPLMSNGMPMGVEVKWPFNRLERFVRQLTLLISPNNFFRCARLKYNQDIHKISDANGKLAISDATFNSFSFENLRYCGDWNFFGGGFANILQFGEYSLTEVTSLSTFLSDWMVTFKPATLSELPVAPSNHETDTTGLPKLRVKDEGLLKMERDATRSKLHVWLNYNLKTGEGTEIIDLLVTDRLAAELQADRELLTWTVSTEAMLTVFIETCKHAATRIQQQAGKVKTTLSKSKTVSAEGVIAPDAALVAVYELMLDLEVKRSNVRGAAKDLIQLRFMDEKLTTLHAIAASVDAMQSSLEATHMTPVEEVHSLEIEEAFRVSRPAVSKSSDSTEWNALLRMCDTMQAIVTSLPKIENERGYGMPLHVAGGTMTVESVHAVWDYVQTKLQAKTQTTAGRINTRLHNRLSTGQWLEVATKLNRLRVSLHELEIHIVSRGFSIRTALLAGLSLPLLPFFGAEGRPADAAIAAAESDYHRTQLWPAWFCEDDARFEKVMQLQIKYLDAAKELTTGTWLGLSAECDPHAFMVGAEVIVLSTTVTEPWKAGEKPHQQQATVRVMNEVSRVLSYAPDSVVVVTATKYMPPSSWGKKPLDKAAITYRDKIKPKHYPTNEVVCCKVDLCTRWVDKLEESRKGWARDAVRYSFLNKILHSMMLLVTRMLASSQQACGSTTYLSGAQFLTV